MPGGVAKGLLVVIVALSGACALIFQTVWFRELRLFFGGSTPATATVLAVFMGGLGLGNAWLGKYVERSERPLFLYACFEGLIAVSAALSPWLIGLAGSFYLALGGQGQLGFTGATLVRLVLSACLLLVPTVFMGGTLPAIAKVVTATDDRARRSLGFYYGVNTLGAVLGTLLATFWLLESYGNRATLWCASAVGMGLSLTAARLSRYEQNTHSQATEVEPMVPSHGKKPRRSTISHEEAVIPLSPAVIYFSAGVVGFAFFLMELVWYRMLGPLLGGNTFTFGLILGTALFGIGLGGAMYSFLFSRLPRTATLFAATCAWEAVALAMPLALGDDIAVWMCRLRAEHGASFSGLLTTWLLITLVVVGPAALISGIQFPLLISLLGQGKQGVGKHVGWACTWNTLGAMLGSLVGGFGILPLLSAPGAWRAVVVILIGLAIVVLILSVRKRTLVVSLLPAAGVVFAALLLRYPGPSAVWRHSGIGVGLNLPAAFHPNALRNWMNSDCKQGVLWERDGVESAIAIKGDQGLAFIMNGKSDGNAVSDCATQIMLGALAPLLHGEARSALLVGLGTGESAGFLAEAPGMERVDVVELESNVDEMAKRCALANFNVLAHPKVNRIYNDARETLLTTNQVYDVIVSEPSNPYRVGVAALFTEEFYQAARARLAPGGYFVQWLQGYSIDEATVQSVLATLHTQFPTVEIWNGAPEDLLLICSVEPREYEIAALRERLRQPHYARAAIIAWDAESLEGVFANHVANAQFTKRLAQATTHTNTDDLNRLEYGFARSLKAKAKSMVPELFRAAQAAGETTPPLRGELDLNRVEIERLNMCMWSDRELPSEWKVSPENAPRLAAYRELKTRTSMSASRAFWETFTPRTFLELQLFTTFHAAKNKARVMELIEASPAAHTLPGATMLLRALCAHQAKDMDEAKQYCLQAWRLCQEDPWVNETLHVSVNSLAIGLASKDPEFARSAFVALQPTFALHAMNAARLDLRFTLAQNLSPREQAEATESYEPYIPWDALFLKTRRDAYHAVKHPLAKQASDDYAAFMQHRGEGE